MDGRREGGRGKGQRGGAGGLSLAGAGGRCLLPGAPPAGPASVARGQGAKPSAKVWPQLGALRAAGRRGKLRSRPAALPGRRPPGPADRTRSAQSALRDILNARTRREGGREGRREGEPPAAPSASPAARPRAGCGPQERRRPGRQGAWPGGASPAPVPPVLWRGLWCGVRRVLLGLRAATYPEGWAGRGLGGVPAQSGGYWA